MAFVLAVVGPLLARLRGRWRLAVALGVLGFFAVVTRLEPSVLWATAMARGAVLTRVPGREGQATSVAKLLCRECCRVLNGPLETPLPGCPQALSAWHRHGTGGTNVCVFTRIPAYPQNHPDPLRRNASRLVSTMGDGEPACRRGSVQEPVAGGLPV